MTGAVCPLDRNKKSCGRKTQERLKMSNKCGDCQLFQGSGKCDGGMQTHSANSFAGTCNSFKAPASVFSGKKCGGCRLFGGANVKCGGNMNTHSSNGFASTCNNYASIPG